MRWGVRRSGNIFAMVALQPLSPMPSLTPQCSTLRTPAAESLHRRHSRVIVRLCSCSHLPPLAFVRAEMAFHLNTCARRGSPEIPHRHSRWSDEAAWWLERLVLIPKSLMPRRICVGGRCRRPAPHQCTSFAVARGGKAAAAATSRGAGAVLVR